MPAAERLEDRILLTVVINEILFDPPTGISGDANGDGVRHNAEDEFVEIVNTGPGSVDISGWTLDDDETNVDAFTFPEGTILAENEAAVLFGGGSPTGDFGGALVFADDGMIGNQLANAGDLVELHDDDGNLVDSVMYAGSGGTGVEGGDGQSLTRDPDLSGSFVDHSVATDSGGALFSPGTKIDGSPFNPVGGIVIDDGDAGYSDTGNWGISSIEGREGDVRFAPAGNGSRVATYEFSGLTPGANYEVAATWTAHANRATNAPYTILDSDGVSVLETTLVNQEMPPGDFSADDSDWDKLAVVNVSGSTLTVRLSNAADQYVIADAIRVVETEEAPPELVIIDDGEDGFAATAGWSVSASEGRQNDVRYRAAGSGAEVATWTFTGLEPGHYRVSATWTAHANRATNAPFTILDGTDGSVLATSVVDQEMAPYELIANGSAWDDLAVVTITGSELVVELSNAANGYVIADAIRIERSSTPPPPPEYLIIDDGDAGYTDTGWAQSPVMEGRLGDLRYAPAGNGSQTATWTFTGLTPGNYAVAATWTAHANRATNAPFTIYDGSGGDVLEMVLVDQELAPTDFTANGSDWKDLAIVTISGTELVVELSNDANQYVIADAIRIAPTDEGPTNPPGTIIDDGDAEFATTTGWGTSLSEGRDSDIRYAAAGNGSRIAMWTFTGLTAGTYRVSATWSSHANRASDAPFTLYDGATSLGTVDVNQRLAPDDFTTQGSDWEDLMEVEITGDALIVELSNKADGFVIADAIRVQPHPLVEPVSILAWNVESGGNNPAVIADQLSTLAGYDIYALSEVGQNDAMLYDDALGPGFSHILSASGGADRLQIIFDEARFELLDSEELDSYGGFTLNNGTHRSPLVLILRDRDSNVVFQVMANHLARGDDDLRTEQAMGLREWGRDQTLPTITIGDFNMDFDFPSEMGNEAFTEMLKDNVWQWVRPDELIDTNWSDSDGDGMDNFPDSMLDFAFVAGPAKDWQPVSNVIVREGDFPDDESTSDHRPIELLLAP